MNPGEIVCDSILENKEMTKTYWEERMMAAASDENKTHKDSVQTGQYYIAESTLIGEAPDSLELLSDSTADTSPKIVETVAKSRNEEIVIEREIGLQQEKEAPSVQDRDVISPKNEDAVSESSPPPPFSQLSSAGHDGATTIVSPTENRIALELREMREREEELRQLRQRFSSGASVGDLPSDTFQSIPTTDEGNFSEYGSEEKELSLDGGNSSSRMMSPEVPLSQGTFTHQRTQSMDSMSSGHSSGSGGLALLPPAEQLIAPRRRITVKPLEEPEEEEVPAYIRNRMTETPIEREIRQAAQREEDLRREKGVQIPVSPAVSPSPNKWTGPRPGGIANDSRDVQHRLATSRIQQEIQEATQREKELVAAGQIQTISEDTVDSKVTRFTELAEYAIAEQEKKKQKSDAVLVEDTTTEKLQEGPSIPSPPPPKTVVVNTPRTNSVTRPASITITPVLLPATPVLSPVANTVKTPMKSPSPMTNGTPRFRKFEPVPGQRGLMQRFLASKGRLVGMSPFTASPNTPQTHRSRQNSSPSLLPSPMLSPQPIANTAPILSTKQVERVLTPDSQKSMDCVDSRQENSVKQAPHRRGYMSAEEKIQEELQEMKKREDELRLQRAHMFAQSQPNLLSLMDDDDDDSCFSLHNKDERSVSSLRTALSNPNLLDSDDSSSVTDSSSYQEKISKKAIRKRSALIAQWENMIQQYSEH